MKNIVVLVGALVLAVASAEAQPQQPTQSTALTTKDHGVLGAMRRMHCHRGWLSRVYELSDIDPLQARLLVADTPIVAPTDCRRTPSAAIMERTRQELEEDVPLAEVPNKKLIAENRRLAVQKNQLTEIVRTVNDSLSTSETDLDRYQHVFPIMFRALRSSQQEALAHRYSIGWNPRSFCAGFFLAVIVWISWYFGCLKQRAVIAYKKLTPWNGKRRSELTLEKVGYHCSLPGHQFHLIDITSIRRHMVKDRQQCIDDPVESREVVLGGRFHWRRLLYPRLRVTAPSLSPL